MALLLLGGNRILLSTDLNKIMLLAFGIHTRNVHLGQGATTRLCIDGVDPLAPRLCGDREILGPSDFFWAGASRCGFNHKYLALGLVPSSSFILIFFGLYVLQYRDCG